MRGWRMNNLFLIAVLIEDYDVEGVHEACSLGKQYTVIQYKWSPADFEGENMYVSQHYITRRMRQERVGQFVLFIRLHYDAVYSAEVKV